MNPRPKDKWVNQKQNSVIPVNAYRVNYLSKSKKKNKFNASKIDFNGIRFDSKLEARVYEDLLFQLNIGDLKEIFRQVKIPLMVNEVLICTYICDFKTIDKHGQVTYVEAKGMEMPVFRIKLKLFLALLPSIDPGAEFRMIKA